MSAARTATAPPRDARPYAPRPSTTIAAHCAPAAASRAAARLCEPRTIPDILARGALDTLNRNVTLSGRDKLSDLARKQSFSTAFSHTCSSAKCLEKWYPIRKAVVLAVNFFDSFYVFSPRPSYDQVCHLANVEFNKDTTSRTEGIWTGLPATFELPPWADLIKKEDV